MVPREQFVNDLSDLEDKVEGMATLARDMLRDGVKSLRKLDRELANTVIASSDALADQDEQIEAAILTFLTLQQPMARDLRRLGAALKLITYINRVGRYGYDVARVTRDWPEDRDHVANMVSLGEMASKVEGMLTATIQAFRDNTTPEFEEILELERDVDAMRYAIFRECLTYMAQDPHNIEPCAHYMMVARYLERCGDNVVKMVEKLHYAKTGTRIILE